MEAKVTAVIPRNIMEPVTLRFDRSFWLAATVIAVQRQLVNDPIRQPRRNRGAAKNLHNDLQGAVGELAAYERLRKDLPGPHVKLFHGLVDFAGPVDDVDFVVRFPDRTRPLRLEAKALLLEQNKQWFLVNETAYHRSLAREADAFLSTITSIGAGVARQACVQMPAVAAWKRLSFQYGDPALGKRVAAIARDEFSVTPGKLRAGLSRAREQVITTEELDDAASTAGRLSKDAVRVALRDESLIEVLAALVDK